MTLTIPHRLVHALVNYISLAIFKGDNVLTCVSARTEQERKELDSEFSKHGAQTSACLLFHFILIILIVV